MPDAVRYALYGTPLVVTLLSLVSRKSIANRIAGVVIAWIVCGSLALFVLRPMHFGWDAAGIHDQTFGPVVTIPWTDVRDARIIPGYLRTGYAPVVRTGGTAFGHVRSGYFRLANGMNVRVFIQGGSDDALLLQTPERTYLYAPNDFGDLVAVARTGLHVPIAEATP